MPKQPDDVSFPSAPGHSPLKPDVDVVWIEPGFALGSRPYSYQQRAIAGLGIRVIVSLHEPAEGEEEAWQAYGIHLISIPTRDWVEIPIANFDSVVTAVSSCLDSGTPVLLHCLAGMNRGPTFAAAVLCRTRGMTVDAALAAVTRSRAAAKPTPQQEKSLRLWYRVMNNRA